MSVSDILTEEDSVNALASLPDDVLAMDTDADADPNQVQEPAEEAEPEQSNSDEQSDEQGDQLEAQESEATTPTDEDQEPLVEVTLPGGIKQELPLSEVVRGYSRTEDYKQKTETVANEARQFQQQQQEQGERYLNQLKEFEALIPKDEEPSIDLLQEDPYEYQMQKALYDKRQADRQRIQAEIQQQETTMRQEVVRTETEALQRAWPEYLGKDTGPELHQKFNQTLKDVGYSDEEISGLLDHRAYLLVKMAIDGAASKAKAPEARKILKQKPPVLRPGAKQTAQAKSQQAHKSKRDKLAKSGDVQDAADVFLDLID